MDSISYGSFKVKYLEILPSDHACPSCGQLAKRNSRGQRTIQEPDLEKPSFLMVHMSVCQCKNPDCPTHYFRIPLPFIAPRMRYSPEAVSYSVESVRRDGMPFCRVPDRMADDFYLYPVKSTVWGWHGRLCDAIDLSKDYDPFVKATFSGVLCMDEVYDGPFCMILSTDPINDITVAYTLETKMPEKKRAGFCQAWLDRHLARLAKIGIDPQVVIRDGSPVYDNGLPCDWDQARCVFHLLQDITKDVLKAVNAYRKSLPDPPKRSRGRPKADAPPAPASIKTEIWHHRYLFVCHDETIEERARTCAHLNHPCYGRSEDDILTDLCDAHPRLGTIRRFMGDIYDLFSDEYTSLDQVQSRYQVLCLSPEYRDNVDLYRALSHLQGDTLEKACLHLLYDNLPRTNNHVERKVRRFRKGQKHHYKLRRSHTIDRAMKADLMRQKQRKQARGDPVVRLRKKADATAQEQLARVA